MVRASHFDLLELFPQNPVLISITKLVATYLLAVEWIID
jgi:hypothetical protein